MDQMVRNQTLIKIGEDYVASENEKPQDIEESFIHHFSIELNDSIAVPYGKARVDGRDTKGIIDEYLERYAERIEHEMAKMGVANSTRTVIKAKLLAQLDEKYIY